MNVLLVSQCQKRALTESRRILDQYAERRGQRTWQTPITAQGLETLRRVLKKSARRNTAIACHWIRGRNHSELMWIVGNASRFNEEGAVPTNTTQQDVLKLHDENDWHTAHDIRLLTEMAALFHDFGKANNAFAKKLLGGKPIADAYRHEWVSLRMFEAFVNKRSDTEWLAELANADSHQDDHWLSALIRDDTVKKNTSPFDTDRLPTLARMIGWLIVSHHRLPIKARGEQVPIARQLKNLPAGIFSSWNGARPESCMQDKAACWSFAHGSPMQSKKWRIKAGKLAKRMQERQHLATQDWLLNPYVAHLSRLTLMLADHYYSSQPSLPLLGDSDFPLFANTDRKTGKHKQRLDEHLIGVANHSTKIARTLPRLRELLPRIARHKGFKKRTRNPHFRWQDKAFDLATSLQERSERQGFFGVNMASTGCGKTLANGRIMYGLADPKLGARFSIALGLRTLTLQTGQAYREKLGLLDDDLAIMVGGAAVRQLFEIANTEPSAAARTGSESSEDLLAHSAHVHFEGALPEGALNSWLKKSPDANKLLAAPILVSTIDHLMPSTEGVRGGRQIAPMLRLLSSDLVLDEPDDFGIEDLPGLSRLVHWAGLLGSRVLLSSATLPPALIQGLFEAYLAGRKTYHQNRGIPGQGVSVWCGWFDEFRSEASEHSKTSTFAKEHLQFAGRRSDTLANLPARRLASIHHMDMVPAKERASSDSKQFIRHKVATEFHDLAHSLHQAHHSIDPVSKKRVSFGLIRMANIDPLIDVAHSLISTDAAKNYRVHLCCYHSRHPLLVRSRIERQLDSLLNRTDPERIFRQEPQLRKYLNAGPETDQIFIVLASPVAEVGRDHDYDWAVIEPSSMRSIIQLAGRIRRHRPGPCSQRNIALLDTNLKHLEGAALAFTKPGFESKQFPLNSHLLTDLLSQKQLLEIDSRPRIIEREQLHSVSNLVDLEHERLTALMLGDAKARTLSVNRWWNTRAALSGELQRTTPFRHDPIGSDNYVMTIEDDESSPRLHLIDDRGELTENSNLMTESAIDMGRGKSLWGTSEFGLALDELATELDMESHRCARRFATFSLPKGNGQGWHYNQHFGFRRSF